jgi:hypothetical protein
MKTISKLNCSNCMFLNPESESVDKSELNNQGGIKDQTKEERVAAQKIKLISLPGNMKVSSKH